MIYFIEAVGAGLVKIGFTERAVEDRLRELQTASPHELRIAGTMVGGLADESRLHQRFASYNTQGEWFALSEEIRSFLAVVRLDSWYAERFAEITKRIDSAFHQIGQLRDRIEQVETASEQNECTVGALWDMHSALKIIFEAFPGTVEELK